MNWRPLSDLYQPGEVQEPVFCSICKRDRRMTRYANTELSANYDRNVCSRCNVAVELECGHIISDDCNLKRLNGKAYHDEAEWTVNVMTMPIDRVIATGERASRQLQDAGFLPKYYWGVHVPSSGEIMYHSKANRQISGAISDAMQYVRSYGISEYVVEIYDTCKCVNANELTGRIVDPGWRLPVAIEVIRDGRPVWRLKEGGLAKVLKGLGQFEVWGIDRAGNLDVHVGLRKYMVTQLGEVYAIR